MMLIMYSHINIEIINTVFPSRRNDQGIKSVNRHQEMQSALVWGPLFFFFFFFWCNLLIKVVFRKYWILEVYGQTVHRHWNRLPRAVVKASCLLRFKKRLGKALRQRVWILGGARNWCQWSLWLCSTLDYSMILLFKLSSGDPLLKS